MQQTPLDHGIWYKLMVENHWFAQGVMYKNELVAIVARPVI